MRFSIKAPLLCACLVLVASGAVFAMASMFFETRLRAAAHHTMSAQLTAELSDIRAGLNAVSHDVSALAQGPLMRAYLSDRVSQADMVDQFVTLLDTHPDYFQARFLDVSGQEVIRVTRTDDEVQVSDRGDLQNKAARYYVAEIMQLSIGDTYTSQLDLNRENGNIERPIRPTIRVAAPVFDEFGERRGGVIVNILGQDVLPQRRFGRATFAIANRAGELLLDPNPDNEFGLETGRGLGFRDVYGLDLPGETAAGALRRVQPVGANQSHLVSARWVIPDQNWPDTEWFAMVSAPRSAVLAPIQADLWKFAFIAVLIGLMACYIGWRLIQHPVGRLEHIAETAKAVMAGDFTARSALSGEDEISVLSQTLDRMTAQIEDLLGREEIARQSLSGANLDLQRANADLESFARAAAHDLKTPLRALSVLPGWIAEDMVNPPEPVRKHLHDMQEQTQRLNRLVDGLLGYSLIGKDRAEAVAFAPGTVLDEVIEMQVPASFEITRAIQMAEITAVPMEFQTLVQNLIGNAIAHHDRSIGHIHVDVTDDGPGRFRLRVSDDGPGIDENLRAYVMEPLSTGKSKDDGAGAGLGLSFVSRIAELRGGHVEILSNTPRGTIVEVLLDYSGSTPMQAAA